MMNKTIQTILVATDFSHKAENATRLAVKMAERHRAKLILLHVIHQYFVTDRTGRQLLGKDLIESYNTKATKALKNLITRMKKDHPSVDAEGKIMYGSLISSTNQIITEESVDLIIMGTSGHQNLKQLFLGSHSYESVKEINCNILLVPEKHHHYNFKNIVFPVRNHEKANQKIDWGVSIAQKNNATINLLGICTAENYLPVKKAFSEARKQLHQNEIEHIPAFVFSDKKAEKISDFTLQSNSDLIILNQDDENSWRSFFAGNFLKKIINKTEVPLLFFKNTYSKKKLIKNYNDINLPFVG